MELSKLSKSLLRFSEARSAFHLGERKSPAAKASGKCSPEQERGGPIRIPLTCRLRIQGCDCQAAGKPLFQTRPGPVQA